jgi:hypothetical protein
MAITTIKDLALIHKAHAARPAKTFRALTAVPLSLWRSPLAAASKPIKTAYFEKEIYHETKTLFHHHMPVDSDNEYDV